MAKVLVVVWDGAGNLPAPLGLAQRLVHQGHDVRLLGHRSILRRCGDQGWRFQPFMHAADHDSTIGLGADEDRFLAEQLVFSKFVARDVQEELEREPADLLLADCMLLGALCVGEALALPTVALFHAAFALFRGGPLADMLSIGLPALNALRDDLGLPPVANISEVHDACAVSLVTSPREFEPATRLPPNVRFVGPVSGPPALIAGVDGDVAGLGDAPVVVVSFSTSDQGQLPVLQRLVSALADLPISVVVTTGPAVDPNQLEAAPNARVERYVAHDRLLPFASLVVTHAGLGTVMSALSHGVPMVCMPMGRDQFFNAAQVEALGVGRTISTETDKGTIAAVIDGMLHDEVAHDNARHFSNLLATYQGALQAERELELFLRP